MSDIEYTEEEMLLFEAARVLEEVLVSGNMETGPYAPAPYSLSMANDLKYMIKKRLDIV